MLKQFLILIALSLIAIFAASYLHTALTALLNFHHWILSLLDNIFSGGQIAVILKSLIALLIIPIVAGFVISFLYGLIKHQRLPHFMLITWVLWLVITTLVLAH